MMHRQVAIVAALVAACLTAPLTAVAAPAPVPTPAATPVLQAGLTDAFTALVTKVVRKVEWQRVKTQWWQKASVDSVLMVGDTLRTGADAKAELLYGDGSVTRVGSLTSLTLTGENKRELHLDAGRVWLHIRKGGAGMRVITPGAVAAVTGTELMVEFDPQKKTTEVTVFEGAVNVTGDIGNLVKVLGGTTTLVPFRAPAAAPLPLDNRKIQERENIFRPLSLPDSTPATTEPDSGSATPAPETTPNPNPTTLVATPGPTTGPTVGTATPAPHDPNGVTEPDVPTPAPTTAVDTTATKPVTPDLKDQTKRLGDPRVINGSPTTGGVRVIIE